MANKTVKGSEISRDRDEKILSVDDEDVY